VPDLLLGRHVTDLWYTALNQLARIDNPGAEKTDFGYDAKGCSAASARSALTPTCSRAASPPARPDDLITTAPTQQPAHVRQAVRWQAPKANIADTTRLTHNYTTPREATAN